MVSFLLQQSVAKDALGAQTGARKLRLIPSQDAHQLMKAVAVKKDTLFNRIFTLSWTHIRLEIGGHKVLVNINSLSKRLDIKKNEINKKRKVDLVGAINKKFMASVSNRATDSYSSREDSPSSSFTESLSLSSPSHQSSGYWNRSENVLFIQQIGNKWTLKTGPRNIVEVQFIEQNKIGEGAFSLVYSVDNNTIIKKLKDKKLSEDYLREHQILSHLWEGEEAPLPGIQACPRKVVQMSGGKESGPIGLMAPRYSGDLDQMIVNWAKGNECPSVADRLAMIAELFAGLELCHRKGIVHGDIKPANIFIDGERRLKLGDFGGSKMFSEIDEQKSNPAFSAAYSKKLIQVDEVNSETYQRNDILALALVAYQILTLKTSEEYCERDEWFSWRNIWFGTTEQGYYVNPEKITQEQLRADLVAAGIDAANADSFSQFLKECIDGRRAASQARELFGLWRDLAGQQA